MQKTTLIVSLFLTSVIGCSDITDSDKLDSNSIQCTVSIESSLPSHLTKGTPINSATDAEFKNIGILGYHTPSMFASTTSPTSSFLPNVEVDKSGDNQWNFDKTYLWPQTGKVSFFAYAPYASSTNGITIESIQGATPSLSYTVPTSVANQPDLMVATPQMDLFKTTVPLQFTHALACVGFDVSGENVPIEYIGVKGIYTSGKLMLNMTNKLPQWVDLTGISTDLYEIGLIPNAEATNPTTPVMATNGYLMMLPQTLGDDAAIVVKFEGIDAKEIPLKNAGTTTWTAGNKYIYTLKEGTYTLDIAVTGNNCQYPGGDVTLNIKSIYTTQAGLTQDLGWKAVVVSSTPSDSYWTSIFNDDLLNNQTTPKTFEINTAPYTTTSVIDNTLKNADSVLYQNIKDLSYVNGSYTTSNTYVVNAPGWYKFPCWVMGNAISKASDANTINNADCISNSSPFFKDYTGADITSINQLAINTQGANAQLIWSDAPNLVSNLGISADQKYIEFYVSPETIRQGNAIVSIQKNGKVMWSWQIWVTDWIMYTNTQNLGAGNQNIMPFGVGRCSAATYNYDQRSITIRFTQNTSNVTKEVTIVQQPSTIEYGENVSYYQWGRKDPMLGSTGLGAQYKACFGPTPFTISETTTPVPVNSGILYPQTFYPSPSYPSNWETPIYVTLWGDKEGSSASIKTIFDPSPAGYMVPDLNTMYSFLGMGYQFEQTPIMGCKFSPNNNSVFNVFLAVTGGLGPNDAAIMGAETGDWSGYYWSNSSYDLNESSNENTFLNLLFSANKTPQLYPQVNPSASALPVCPAIE